MSGDKDYAEGMEGMRMVLEEFGEGMTGLVSTDALGILILGISVYKLQKNLHQLLGLRQQIGPIDKLVEQVEKSYSDRVVEVIKSVGDGGHKAEVDIMKFVVDISVGAGMRIGLACMTMARIWALENGESCSQKIKDVAQVMCRLDPDCWDEYKDECTGGGGHEELLDDTDVRDLHGFMALSAESDGRTISAMDFDRRWLKLIVCASRVMSYQPVEEVMMEKAIADFHVDGAGHPLVQKESESIRDLMARHREALVTYRRRLIRLDRVGKAPDAFDLGLNLLQSARVKLKDWMHYEMSRNGVRPDQIDMQRAMILLKEAERSVTTLSLRFNSTSESSKAGNKDKDKKAQKEEKEAAKKKPTRSDEGLARSAYARHHGYSNASDVTNEMIEKGGGMKEWRKLYKDKLTYDDRENRR